MTGAVASCFRCAAGGAGFPAITVRVAGRRSVGLVSGALAVLLVAGVTAGAGAAPLPVLAGTPDPRGLYVSLGAGATWPQPIRYSKDQAGLPLPILGTVLADPGPAVDLGLGYDFGRWRPELSYGHRRATIAASRWSLGRLPLAAAVADPLVSSNSVFASLYVDLPLKARLVPYVGGGLGYTVVSTAVTTLSSRRGSQSFGGGSKGTVGYQAKVGLSFRASPRSDLYTEVVFQGAPGRSNDSFERSALSSWGWRLGWRYRFGSLQAGAPASTPP